MLNQDAKNEDITVHIPPVSAAHGGTLRGAPMPGFQAVLAHLNGAFGKDYIDQLAERREAFAPGMPLAAGLVIKKGTRLHALWVEYLSKLPGSFQEAFRATV